MPSPNVAGSLEIIFGWVGFFWGGRQFEPPFMFQEQIQLLNFYAIFK